MGITVAVRVAGATGIDAPGTWAVSVTGSGNTVSSATNEAPSVDLDVGTYKFKLDELPDGYVLPPADVPVTVSKDQNDDYAADPAEVSFVVGRAPSCSVSVSVRGPDDSKEVASWVVKAAGPITAEIGSGATAQTLTLDREGTYKLFVSSIADSHIKPEATVDVVVSSANGQFTADPAEVEFVAATALVAKGELVTPASIALIVGAMLWVPFILLLPDPTANYIKDTYAIIAFALALAVAAVGAGLLWLRGVRWLAVSMVLIGTILAFTFAVLSKSVTLGDPERLAICMGGLALASFVIGLTFFESIKGAASLPIVVVFIAVVVWPSFADTPLDDSDLRKTIISWIAIIIGVAVGGEAIQQATQNIANGNILAASVGARGTSNAVGTVGAFGEPENLSELPTPEVSSRQVPTVPAPHGDLARRR